MSRPEASHFGIEFLRTNHVFKGTGPAPPFSHRFTTWLQKDKLLGALPNRPGSQNDSKYEPLLQKEDTKQAGGAPGFEDAAGSVPDSVFMIVDDSRIDFWSDDCNSRPALA